jgi:hypothetical protein
MLNNQAALVVVAPDAAWLDPTLRDLFGREAVRS